MSGEGSEIMHLTQLERESAGAYACGASNSEGETRSSSLTLKVQCKYQDLAYAIHIAQRDEITWRNRKRKLQNKIKINRERGGGVGFSE